MARNHVFLSWQGQLTVTGSHFQRCARLKFKRASKIICTNLNSINSMQYLLFEEKCFDICGPSLQKVPLQVQGENTSHLSYNYTPPCHPTHKHITSEHRARQKTVRRWLKVKNSSAKVTFS